MTFCGLPVGFELLLLLQDISNEDITIDSVNKYKCFFIMKYLSTKLFINVKYEKK